MLYVKRIKQQLPSAGDSVELNNYLFRTTYEGFICAKFVYLSTGKFVYDNDVSRTMKEKFKVSITRWEF